MAESDAPTMEDLRKVVGAVTDPELPPLTLVDLGILRSVEEVDDGEATTVVVTVTPTYSGCPAVEYIEEEIARVLDAAGCERFRVERSLSPAWTTDWVTAEGRRKLTELGIAPPGPAAGPTPVTLGRRAQRAPVVACPRCGAVDTEVVSAFGSTACKALYRCRACSEPFDHFKAI
jgi:ring-1,2-phenylacetyl-CoA epoxidase subunit PaaD